jgi:hypothetical protein
VYGLFATDLAAEQLDRAVRQNLIDVHVGLRARTRLPDVEREVLVELARDRLVGAANYSFRLPLRQPAGRGIDQCCRLLDIAIGVINARRHAVVADREMDQAALRLGSPIAVGRHLDFAHRVGFAAGSGCANADRGVVRFVMGLVVHVTPPFGVRRNTPRYSALRLTGTL